MIIFKILLIILIAAPFIAILCALFYKAREYSVKLNREDRAMERERRRRRTGGYY
ncbi:MAG: hypothetical protein KBS63_00400 [Clostridiales bacterium]|nr:hypothetical protein [Candidatus Crickella caballi]